MCRDVISSLRLARCAGPRTSWKPEVMIGDRMNRNLEIKVRAVESDRAVKLGDSLFRDFDMWEMALVVSRCGCNSTAEENRYA
jgi:hypothetical protein